MYFKKKLNFKYITKRQVCKTKLIIQMKKILVNKQMIKNKICLKEDKEIKMIYIILLKVSTEKLICTLRMLKMRGKIYWQKI